LPRRLHNLYRFLQVVARHFLQYSSCSQRTNHLTLKMQPELPDAWEIPSNDPYVARGLLALAEDS